LGVPKVEWNFKSGQGEDRTAGILMSKDFAPSVDQVIAIQNARENEKGNKYDFMKKTQPREGIESPKL
jgi:hypothetical protein